MHDLEKITEIFFQNHLPQVSKPPQWSVKWAFIGGLPNTEKKGCYALFDENDQVIYIGLAIGNNSGIYQGAGIGQRLNRLFRWTKKSDSEGNRIYESTKAGVSYIRTIPFPEDYFYLAAAFEVFAILELNGLSNVTYNQSG